MAPTGTTWRHCSAGVEKIHGGKQDYTSAGGRVFASHWHSYWFQFGPAPFPSVAQWNPQPDLPNPFTASIDQTFPKGQAMADWLGNVGGSSPGNLVIVD